MGKKAKPKGSRPSTSGFEMSPLEAQRRVGKTLSPPFARIGNLSPVSWSDQAINENLWAIVLRGNIERDACLGIFRKIIAGGHALPNRKDLFLTHSVLSALSADDFDALLAPVLGNEVLPGNRTVT